MEDFNSHFSFTQEFYNSMDEVDDSYIPHNGTGTLFIQPTPKFKYEDNPEKESFYQQPEGLIDRLSLADLERLNNDHLILNRVVYDSIDASPLNKKDFLGPYYVPSGKNDTTVVFESRFECGNLRRAIQVYEFEYDLILKFDVNTRSHTQWYYFSVDNVTPGVKYKFNLINFLKSKSLYNEGMKPLVFSVEKNRKNGTGWFRGGFEIGYYQNTMKRKSGYYYTLSFSYVFGEKGKHYFSYCYPYAYSDLKRYLNKLELDPVRRNFLRRRTLCQTLAGNNTDLLTITNFSCNPSDLKKRKGVVISARSHPGESNGSWMMKGVLDLLTSGDFDAQILRQNFIFKIVPMLNPDGVINGNYRCSLAASDLNRKWDFPSKKLHPTVYHTKEMIRQFQKENDVILYCDLHGHSRKHNIFTYGCYRGKTRKEKLETRIFPRILWKVSNSFSYQDCNWNMNRKKESSARMVVFKELGVTNSFTLEASFCGATFGRGQGKHFTQKDYEKQGHSLLESILDLCDPEKNRLTQVIQELNLLYPSIDQIQEEENGDDVGSGSDEDEKNEKKKKKKKKKKSSKKLKRSNSISGTNISKEINKEYKKKLKKVKMKKGSNENSSQNEKKKKNNQSKSSPKKYPEISGSNSKERKKKKKNSNKEAVKLKSLPKRKKAKKRMSAEFFESYKAFRNKLFKENKNSNKKEGYFTEVLFNNNQKKFIENYVLKKHKEKKNKKNYVLPKINKKKKKKKNVKIKKKKREK